MKILGIVCSPRKGGNTEILVSEALASAKDLGAAVELLTIADKNISPCDGCESCMKISMCKIKDDMQDIYPKLLESDGIILGTPVYFWSVCAQAKALIDRTYPYRKYRRLRNKVGGAIIVARRAGASDAFDVLQNFFIIHKMVPATGALAYGKDEEINITDRAGGAIGYADKQGQIRQDERGMQEARTLGMVIVKTITRIKELGQL